MSIASFFSNLFGKSVKQVLASEKTEVLNIIDPFVEAQATTIAAEVTTTATAKGVTLPDGFAELIAAAVVKVVETGLSDGIDKLSK